MKILVVIILVAAVADDARAAGSEATAAALKNYEEGRAAFDANQLDVALEKFEASNELQPSPNSRLYIGRCYRGLDKFASAYVSFELAAREAQDRVSATGEKRYAATRAAAIAEAAAIAPLVSHLTIEVAGDAPAGVVVTKDGEAVNRAAWGTPLAVDPGDVIVEARAPRSAPFAERFKLTPGEERHVHIALERVPSAVIALQVATSAKELVVELDGRVVDAAADGAHEVDPGRHTIVAHAPGYDAFRWEGALAPGDRGDVVISLHAELRALLPRNVARGSAIGAAAAGVAALAVAAGLTADAEHRNDLETSKSPYARTAGARDTIRNEAIAGSVLFAAGGVLVAASGALTYFGWRKERARRVSVAPALSATTAALVVGGSF